MDICPIRTDALSVGSIFVSFLSFYEQREFINRGVKPLRLPAQAGKYSLKRRLLHVMKNALVSRYYFLFIAYTERHIQKDLRHG